MLRLTPVVAVALVVVTLASAVLAGPTVRRDEVANVVSVADGDAPKPMLVESAAVALSDEKVAAASVPVKLPPAEDEQADSEPTNVPDLVDAASTTKKPATTTTATTKTSAGSTTPSATSTTPKTTTTTTQVTATTSGAPTTKPPRKTITFDQRQEGKYNIRADLENFVIVVVPSGSSSGASLLDFLTRSAQKKKDASHHHHHHHGGQTRGNGKRKHNTPAQGAAAPAAGKQRAPQGPVTPEVIVLDESNQRSAALVTEEFIEGRTPYKVDLSSSARSVDGDAETAESAPQSAFRFRVEPSAYGRVRFPHDAATEHAPLRPDVDMAQLQLQREDGDGDVGDGDHYEDLADRRQDQELAGWDQELRLLGAQEQCGPDRKRDSYGVCQFVPA